MSINARSNGLALPSEVMFMDMNIWFIESPSVLACLRRSRR